MFYIRFTRNARGLAFFCIVMIVTFIGFPALAKKSSQKNGGTPKYVTIPVLFVTDREQVGDSYGARRRYPVNCQHNMYYGTAMVSIANEQHKSADTTRDNLGWQFSDMKPEKIAKKDNIGDVEPEAAKSEFFKRMETTLTKSGDSNLCLFVHGAADAFEDCLQDAATMAYYMEKPMVLYSWPSDPKWRGYFIDSSNNEWSQGHFNTFCKDLLAYKEQHPLTVTSFSHSMGNRLVIRALSVVYGTKLITQWELISPDIDADTCRHYTMGFTPTASKIRLFVSNRDKMLPLSQILAGGYYRLGEAIDPMMIKSQEYKKLPSGLVERIDFTAVDKGLMGHTIPFNLVSNIVKNNEPGDGLQMVPQRMVKGNRLVKFADRSQKLENVNENYNSEFYKKVLPVERTKSKN